MSATCANCRAELAGVTRWLGLNDRTTVWERSPGAISKRQGAPRALTHQPIDLVIVMLGTNDLKGRFGVGARDIAAGAGLAARQGADRPVNGGARKQRLLDLPELGVGDLGRRACRAAAA